MTTDFAAWIIDALDRKPHLNRLGLARHVGKNPAWVTLVLSRRREIKAGDLEKVEEYLGETHPGVVSGIKPLTIAGRIGSAWYEPGQAPSSDIKVAPVLAFTEGRQVAYLVDRGYPGFPDGSIIIATPLAKNARPARGAAVILRRERAGLENFRFAKYVGGGTGTPIAIAIEVRIPLEGVDLFLARPRPAHRLPNT